MCVRERERETEREGGCSRGLIKYARSRVRFDRYVMMRVNKIGVLIVVFKMGRLVLMILFQIFFFFLLSFENELHSF